jgi:hypothetical protein
MDQSSPVQKKGGEPEGSPLAHQQSSLLFEGWVAIDARVAHPTGIVVVNNAVLH